MMVKTIGATMLRKIYAKNNETHNYEAEYINPDQITRVTKPKGEENEMEISFSDGETITVLRDAWKALLLEENARAIRSSKPSESKESGSNKQKLN